MQKQTITVIDYSEFETLVAEHLGDHDFQFVVDARCSSTEDSEHLFALASRTTDDGTRFGWEHEIEQYERYLAAHGEDPYTRPTYYLAKLIEKGLIDPEHMILVTVS